MESKAVIEIPPPETKVETPVAKEPSEKTLPKLPSVKEKTASKMDSKSSLFSLVE